jgi:polyphenol oxidase
VGLPVDRVLFMRQMHGTDVAVVDGPWSGQPPSVDALITATPGLALGVLVADCLPVLMADPGAGVTAAVHAGRRGIAHGVIHRALAAMTDLGAEPGRMQVVIGPAVCGRCYEVPEQLQAEFTTALPDAATRTATGTPALDLPAAVHTQLKSAAVDPRCIEIVGRCTVEDPTLFSYRRDGRTGRQAGLIWRGTADAI